MDITEEQKQTLQGITIHNGTNAWKHVMQEKEEDRYWVALGILSCVKNGYGLTILEINSEARSIRSGRKKY